MCTVMDIISRFVEYKNYTHLTPKNIDALIKNYYRKMLLLKNRQ